MLNNCFVTQVCTATDVKSLTLLVCISHLPTCGLIFFSKQRKNERWGNLKKLLECLQAQKAQIQALQNPPLVPMIFQLHITLQTSLSLQDSSVRLSIWILSLRQFLSILPFLPLQGMIPPDCLRGTENGILARQLDVNVCTQTLKICLVLIFHLFILKAVYSNFGLIICCKKRFILLSFHHNKSCSHGFLRNISYSRNSKLLKDPPEFLWAEKIYY